MRPVFSLLALLPLAFRAFAAEPVAPLPSGVQAVWAVEKAFRETTPTRERLSLNGLWQWQPADAKADIVPDANWGWFKVPGSWPGITDYMQKDCQSVIPHASWKERSFGQVSAAWHERQFTVPSHWTGRRILFSAAYLNSFAAVFVDGQRVGELHFPGGELDLTAKCRPGSTHTLSLLVVALPLKGVMLSYTDSASAREVKGAVERRGLCGDVWLVSTPAAARLADARTTTSVRRKEIAFDCELENVPVDANFRLRARVLEKGAVLKEFTSGVLGAADLREGRFAFTNAWLPDRLWDTHTPQHQFAAELALLDDSGRALDVAHPVSFGFREFWIEGRDFYLNGTRLFLSVIPLDNAQVSAGLATYAAALESFARLQSFGINAVYTHNYDCLPGSHLGFEEILRAADDAGMLVSFSQPHFSHYDWASPAAEATNGYARHAAFYVRAAQNHPSVVMYSMSHNATGYNDDMNPDLIDGLQDRRDTWAQRNAQRAVRAEAIVRALDPGRIVYHHASGNLGSMHQINFYPNFAPVQELSDWFGHWATAGVKPLFLCEYGAPFTWDWTMYRGWYQGKREFGSAAVPWEFCLAEWNAQFRGDEAYRISEAEQTNLRWEAKQFRAGKLWHRWDYPHQVGSTVFEERYPVFAQYLTDNWRAFRTWGVSANSPWEHGHFWKLRDGLSRNARQALPTDWERLQRPGFSPDYSEQRYERVDLAYERADWIATPAAEALLRNNRPLLAYIAGRPSAFASKDHNFLPGEVIEKQLIVINNSRETATCDCEWTLALPEPLQGNQRITVPAGQQQRLPLRFELPAIAAPGQTELRAEFRFSTGEVQADRFTIEILPPPIPASSLPGDRSETMPRRDAVVAAKTALFDPRGETRALLDHLGFPSQPISASSELSGFDLLIVGKSALTVDGPLPDIRRVRDGLKVIVFEQTTEVLEQRFGFRVAEYGLRQVFPRLDQHPALDGLRPDTLRDWRGEATIVLPRRELESSAKFNGAPATTWCGLPVTRLWRCGNRGNVASVLIEKPTRGDFLPIVDGGFSLQYSPLLEYREGRGLVMFCQMDVTGRTERDPAADALVANLMRYAATWQPPVRRDVVYAGEPAGRAHLEAAGLRAADFSTQTLLSNHLLVVGPGAAKVLAEKGPELAAWLRSVGRVLALGADEITAAAISPMPVTLRRGEHIASFLEPLPLNSPLAGISGADLHNRDPRDLPLITSGGEIQTGGVLAVAGNVTFCQLVPWQFEGAQANFRRTHRRISFLVARLLGNLGAQADTPLLDRFHTPVDSGQSDGRWLTGFYLDQPQEWDDPYRFFRW